ncbi:FxDxF family PEP-CTERM protein [Sphingomonas floccifaciens]|uniref:FxDxF family PEP-CTERM protein n=1 Tax=Sphingomonas floccifaciens TaxID=1844115 RepID=A0ABW4NK00_9SPHN
MKRIIPAAIAAAIAFGAASSANAAQTLTITGPSGTFGDDSVTCATGVTSCTFERTFTFLTPAGFTLASADIGSNFTGGNMMANIDFSRVTLNGVSFNTLSTGQQEFRNLLNQSLAAGGTNTLFVSGTSGGDAAFAGTLSFASTSAVPEPATWAMMLIGFGAVGATMRRRKQVARVNFA